MAVVFRRLGRDDGQGLIELIVALTILAVGIGAVLTVLTGSALSLQRSDEKGTALTLAEKQLELYRNLAYADIRLDDASWSSAPLTNATDPYFTASSSDDTIPSGAETDEVLDTGTDVDSGAANNACDAGAPECQAVQTVTGPDHRRYRIDTYITTVTPTDNGEPPPVGTPVGNHVRQVTVIVRDAGLSTLPILARNSSTFSKVNAASFGDKQYPNLTINVPRAWVTGNPAEGTSIPSSAVSVTVSNGLYPLSAGTTSGVITLYAIAGATSPSPPCGSDSSDPDWVQFGQATVDSGNVTYAVTGTLPVAAGNTYWWYAAFSGDASNNARTTRCSPAMTTTTVQASKWTPSISVSAPSTATTGTPVDGSKIAATLSDSSPGATGTIHIYYGTAGGCSGGTELGTVSATGDGSYSQSNAFPASTAGTYWWWATYPGDDNNAAATSSCGVGMPSTTVDTGATPSGSPQMFDTNHDGKVDQVTVTFNKTLTACASCGTTGWTLSNAPGGATLASVSASGSTATLTLSGAGVDTSAGTFTLGLAGGTLLDSTGRAVTVPTGTIVIDKASPVLMTATTTAGSTTNKMEQGDTLDLTFSEAVTLPAGSFTVTETRTTGSSATLTIPNLVQSATIAKAYLADKNSTGAATGTATLTNSGKTIHVVLGAVTTTGSGVGTGSGGASLAPAAGITDSASNAVVTTVARTASSLF